MVWCIFHEAQGQLYFLLDLQIDNHICWKNRIDEMIPVLSGVCYAVRSVLHISNTETQINLIASYHFIMKYEIILQEIHQTAKRYSYYKIKLLEL
jgi:hypothetical protein